MLRAGAKVRLLALVGFNIGVERVFALHSPRLESIEVLSRGVVRKARLFYLQVLEHADMVARAEAVAVAPEYSCTSAFGSSDPADRMPRGR